MLKELRKKAGFTQKELSQQIKIDCATLSLYENGKRFPPLNKIPLLANALNVSELEILQCFQNPENNSVNEKEKEQKQ